MRFIEENLGAEAAQPPYNRNRLDELQELVVRLSELYQELGLRPQPAWRSALADFAGDYPGEVAALYRVRSEA